MRLSHPSKPTPLVPWHGIPDPDAIKKWQRLDGKIRMHNLARWVLRKPTIEERRMALDQMEKRHKPDFMARFKRLVKHYWRRQRALQQRKAEAR